MPKKVDRNVHGRVETIELRKVAVRPVAESLAASTLVETCLGRVSQFLSVVHSNIPIISVNR